MNKIPVYKPYLNGNEKLYVNQCLDSSWISSKGEFVNQFETNFANYLSIDYASSVSNGTVALHLALLALDISSNDEVIVPTFTYVASVNAIKYVGATPIFVDSNIDTFNMDENLIEEKITKNTKAIMVAHLYGLSNNMNKIVELCKKYNLYLIEDCAEAIGSKYNSQCVGTFGDIATFSFFGNKTITTGEGGMVVSNNKNLIDKVNLLKNQYVSPMKEYWHDDVGYNYRMTNIAAAIGVAQLEQIKDIITKKIKIANYYKKHLQDLPIRFQKYDNKKYLNTYWMVTILVDNRDELREYLSQYGIETRPTFYPAHILPMFKENKSYFVAEEISKKGINLSSYPALSMEELDYIIKNIRNYFDNR